MSEWRSVLWEAPVQRSLVPFAVVMTALVIAAGCADDDDSTSATKIIHGSGNVVEQTRSASGFRGVNFSSEGNLHIVQAQQEGLRIEADDNLLELIITAVEGGTLSIRTAPGVDLRPSTEIEFYVDAVNLDHLVHTGVGGVDANALEADRSSLVFSGVGDILLTEVDADELDIDLSGVYDAVLAGQVSKQVVTLTGVCDYRAKGLTSDESIVTLSGSGSVEVHAENRLVGTITGEGDICYLGEPAVESTITGVGTIAPCK